MFIIIIIIIMENQGELSFWRALWSTLLIYFLTSLFLCCCVIFPYMHIYIYIYIYRQRLLSLSFTSTLIIIPHHQSLHNFPMLFISFIISVMPSSVILLYHHSRSTVEKETIRDVKWNIKILLVVMRLKPFVIKNHN